MSHPDTKYAHSSPRTSDKAFIYTVKALYRLDEGMPGHGAVLRERIAEDLGLADETVSHRCNKLVNDGRLGRARGYDPDSIHPRTGYLPVDANDTEAWEKVPR